MTTLANESLPYLSSTQRMGAYSFIIQACSHLWSKGKLQQDRLKEAFGVLLPLKEEDPYFLAHLTSYALRKTQAKDLQVLTTFVNALSSADGTPFSVGSVYKKPNLRMISAAAVQQMDPKLASRVLELGLLKFGVNGKMNEGRHFSNSLRTALRKYLQYRENNIEIIKGIKKAGMANILKKMYRSLHEAPSDEVAAILRWQQRDHRIEFAKSSLDFTGLTDLQIAEKIQQEKLPVLGVLGALPRVMSPVVAVALLEQATGNQAVILRKTFEDAGVLKDPEVMELYKQKIATAKTALDRAETLSQTASEEVKQALKEARSEKRKEETAGLGKIYMHLDFSGSMGGVAEFAIDRGSIFAECINDPQNNFAWGYFQGYGTKLPLPQTFEKDAFAQVLFGRVGGGSTDCFALYPTAREFGADIDVFVSDQGHTDGNLERKIRSFHEQNPLIPKPKACVIVDFSYGRDDRIKEAYEANGIPVAVLKPESLTESALVVQAVKAAIQGPIAIIDEIMSTELLKLPDYYFAI